VGEGARARGCEGRRDLLGIIQRCFSVFFGQKGVCSILQQKLADFYPLVTVQKGYLV
jgi:hypothetical protein